MIRTKIKNNNLVLLLLGLIFSLSLCNYLEINGVGSVALTLMTLPVFYTLSKYIRRDRKTLSYSVLLGFMIAIIFIIGKQLDLYGKIYWTLGTFIKIIGLSSGISFFINMLLSNLGKIKLAHDFSLTKKHKIIIISTIVLSNFLVWLALYPGLYGWDSSAQAYQTMHGQINGHWSIVLGYIFGNILSFGKDVLGNISYGVAISTLLQLIIMSLIYSHVVFTVNKISKNKAITLLSLAFFIFVSILKVMTVYTTQDVIFGGIFLMLFVQLFKLFAIGGKYEPWKNAIVLLLLGVALCLCRNNGIYIFLFMSIFAIIISKQRKIMLISMASTIVISLLISGPIMSAFGIEKAHNLVNETLSVPSQQIARAYYNNSSLDEATKQRIQYYYDDQELFEKYNDYPLIADYTKNSLNSEKVKDNFLDYIGLWAQTGCQSPRSYIEAFLLNTLGIWYPDKNQNDGRLAIPYLEYDMSILWSQYDGKYQEMKVERNSLFPQYEKYLSSIIRDNEWQSIPVFSILYSPGTYFILTVVVVSFALYNKKMRLLPPRSLICGLFITVLLGPVVLFRYVYPAIITAPILISMLFLPPHNAKNIFNKRKGTKNEKK